MIQFYLISLAQSFNNPSFGKTQRIIKKGRATGEGESMTVVALMDLRCSPPSTQH